MTKKSKLNNFLYYFFLILLFDCIFTHFLFKKTSYWTNINKQFSIDKKWRIKSDLYHHDIAKNIEVVESWGHFNYKLVTNSLGFRDNIQKKITNVNKIKKRIYVNGDSFLEGVGYNYEDTAIGILDKKLNNKYEILNSSVTSYSPSIYYTKTKHYIDKGLKFDFCLTFLDISDVPDENFINEDNDGNIYDIRQKKKSKSFKGKIYKFSNYYKDNFITGRFIFLLREYSSIVKNKYKDKYLASKKFNKSIFNITSEDIDIYKATHIDRTMWTFDNKYSKRWKKKGLEKSSYYLKKLFQNLKEQNIDSYLIIYPNPAQIMFNNENINEIYWENWSKKNNVKLISLYKYFDGPDKKEIIKKYFINGDVHWNKKGNLLVAESIKKEIFDNFNK